jgi:hypothetical protein
VINFPDAPTNGQQFQSSASTWRWDGIKWIPVTTTAPLPLTVPNGGTGAVTLPVNALGFIPPFTTVLLHGQGTNPVITGTANWTIQGGRFAGAEISMISAVSGASNMINMLKGEGTLAAPTNAKSGLVLGAINFGGYDGTYWQTSSCSIQCAATQDWTGSVRGSEINFQMTPNGNTFPAGAIKFTGAGGINTTSDITIVPTTSNHPIINLRKPSGTTGRAAHILGWTANSPRWAVVLGDGADEGGGNSGSNFVVWRYGDNGSLIDAPVSINRVNGETTLAPSAVVIGVGQVGGWSTTGAKGGSILLTDLGQAAGCGGAIEFAAAPNSAWRFAAIKGYATNGGGLSQGEIDFFVRVGASDATLTKKGALASDGVWYNTNASWSAISDVSMKENIAPYTNGLAAIIGLRPVIFDYIEASPFGPVSARIGLVAQEAEEFTPEIIGQYQDGDAPTLKTTSGGLLVYTLINAVKELASRLDGLEAR